MNDEQLDEMLDHDEHVWDTGVTTALAALVGATKDNVDAAETRSRPARRRGLIVGVALAGGLLATAGAGVTAAELGIPPFQTTDPGTVRIATAVPITYTESTGTQVICKAFMELRNVDNATESSLMDSILRHDWVGVGQDAYNDAHGAGGGQAAIATRFARDIDDALFAQAKSVVPQLTRASAVLKDGDLASTSSILWAGSSMSCSPQNDF